MLYNDWMPVFKHVLYELIISKEIHKILLLVKCTSSMTIPDLTDKTMVHRHVQQTAQGHIQRQQQVKTQKKAPELIACCWPVEILP